MTQQLVEARPAPRETDADKGPTRGWAFVGEPWVLVALGVVLATLAQFFPASGDDWAWGSVDGAARYHRWFDHYNGRWAGNLLVLVLTRVTWLAPLVIALTVCLLVHLVTRVAGMRSPVGYAVAIALFVAMPLVTWSQTMVWVSGFSNYVPATVGLLLFVSCAQRDWSGRPWRRPAVTAVGVGALAFVSALFMEHVTVVLTMAAVVHLMLLRSRRADQSRAVSLSWVVGQLGGAALMFSNSIYRSAAEGSASYQKVNHSPLQVLHDGVTGVSALSVGVNTALNTALLLVLLGLVLAHRGRAAVSKAQVGAVIAAGVGLVAGVVITAQTGPGQYFGSLNDFGWVSSVGMLVGIVLGALHLVEDATRRRTILVLTVLAFALIAPATVVQPYTPRVFLPPYVLMTVICLVMLDELVVRWPRLWLRTGVVAVSGVLVTVVLGTYFVVYPRIDQAAQQRIEAIRDQVADGATRVWVPNLPHPGYVHYPDPRSQVYQQRYREYFGLPDALVLDNQPRP